jgi:ATP-binding cassette subfamily F protein uup
MNKLVDHLFVFEGNGKVKDFYGNYTEYRIEKQKAERKSRGDLYGRPNAESRKQKAEKEKGEGLSWKESKELEQLEIEIPKLEEEKDSLLQKMNNGNGTLQELNGWGVAYQNISEEIETKTMRWLELSDL